MNTLKVDVHKEVDYEIQMEPEIFNTHHEEILKWVLNLDNLVRYSVGGPCPMTIN